MTNPAPKSAIHIAQDMVTEWKSKPGVLNLVEDIADALTQYGNARLAAAAELAETTNDRSGVCSVGRGIAQRIRALKEPS